MSAILLVVSLSFLDDGSIRDKYDVYPIETIPLCLAQAKRINDIGIDEAICFGIVK